MNRLAVAIFSAAIVLAPSAASAVTMTLAGTGYTSYALNSVGGFDLDNVGASYTSLTDGFGVDGNTVQVLMSGVKSASSGLMIDGPAKVTYTYLGKEAGFTNSLKFAAGNTTIFQTNTATLGDISGPFNAVAGLLAFKLISNSDADNVFNNGGATTGMNIAYYLLSATSALVFLDDYGAGPDYDFDDIGIRIDIAAVPLPAGLPLLAAGLGALGLLARRRKRAVVLAV